MNQSEELRRHLRSILVVAEMDKHNWNNDTDGYFRVTEDAIMQTLSGWLAALPLPEKKTGDDVWMQHIKSFAFENGYNQAIDDCQAKLTAAVEELKAV